MLAQVPLLAAGAPKAALHPEVAEPPEVAFVGQAFQAWVPLEASEAAYRQPRARACQVVTRPLDLSRPEHHSLLIHHR